MEVADRTEADRKGGHLARRRDGGPRAARDRPDARRGRRRLPGHRAPPLLQHEHAVGRPATRCTRRSTRDGVLGLPMIVNRKTVDPGDTRSPDGHPARDGDGRGDRRLRGRPRAARAAHALRAGQDDERPARRCARTPTCSTDDARVVLADGPRRRRRSSTSTPTTTSSSATSTSASPPGRRRCVACERLTVEGDVAFGAGVVVRGRVDGAPGGRRRSGASTTATVLEG